MQEKLRDFDYRFDSIWVFFSMGRGSCFGTAPPATAPVVAPLAVSGGAGADRDDQWSNFDNSINAVSFGFVATAILISMFLVMAIFERFLRQRQPDSAVHGGRGNLGGLDQIKLGHPSPKLDVYPNGVSVLMPGEEVPTFIAHPAQCASRPTPRCDTS